MPISPISIQKPDWPAHRRAAALTRDQVENSPDIDTDQPVYRQHEVQYLGYYGYPGYWGGTGLWGGGMLPFAMGPGRAELPQGAAARKRAVAGAEAERELHRDDDPHLRSCEAVVGYQLQAADGEVGHVEGFLVDDETWAIRCLVVNTSNGWLGHQVLIARQWIGGVHWSDRTVAADLSRESVKTAPAYDPSVERDRQCESALYAHTAACRTGRPVQPSSARSDAMRAAIDAAGPGSCTPTPPRRPASVRIELSPKRHALPGRCPTILPRQHGFGVVMG